MEGLARVLGTTPLGIFNNEAATFELVVAQMLFASTMLDRRRDWPRVALALLGMMLFDLGLIYARARMVHGYASYLVNFLALFAASCLALGLVLRSDEKTALKLGICGYAVQHVAAAAMEVVIIALEAFLPAVASSWALVELTRIALFALVYALFWRYFVTRYRIVDVCADSPASLYFLVASVLFITVGVSSYAYLVSLEPLAQLVIRSVSLLTCVMILVVFGELSRNQRLSDEIAFMRRMDEMRAQHYEALRDTIETTNIHYHDLKHQLLRLGEALRSEGDGAAREVIGEMSRGIETYADMSKTGNPSLDVVLTQKSATCRRMGIRLTCMVESSCLDWMDDRDIYALFGNALDNAIEAVTRLPDSERRVVKVTASMRAGLAIIHVTNYCDEVLLDKDGRLVTTKEDASSHGYGTKSIRAIVDRLGGEVDMGAVDGIFDLSVALPVPAAAV